MASRGEIPPDSTLFQQCCWLKSGKADRIQRDLFPAHLLVATYELSNEKRGICENCHASVTGSPVERATRAATEDIGKCGQGTPLPPSQPP